MRQRDEGWKLGPLSHSRSSLSRLGGIDREGCGGNFNRFGFMPTVHEDEESDDDYMDDGDNDNGNGNDFDGEQIQANNSRRSDIVREIYIHEIQRPIHNKRRNSMSEYETMDASDDEQHEGDYYDDEE